VASAEAGALGTCLVLVPGRVRILDGFMCQWGNDGRQLSATDTASYCCLLRRLLSTAVRGRLAFDCHGAMVYGPTKATRIHGERCVPTPNGATRQGRVVVRLRLRPSWRGRRAAADRHAWWPVARRFSSLHASPPPLASVVVGRLRGRTPDASGTLPTDPGHPECGDEQVGSSHGGAGGDGWTDTRQMLDVQATATRRPAN